jgi:hypothetical protein
MGQSGSEFVEGEEGTSGLGLLGFCLDRGDRPICLGPGEPVFGFEVVGGLDGHRPERHDLRPHDNPDFLTAHRTGEPMAQLGAGGGDSESLHVF